MDQQTPATQPNQPWQESRYKCQSLSTAAPALSSAFYRAALTVHNCGIETFPLIAENKLRGTWRNFLGVFSLSSTPQFQNSDSGAIDFYRTQVFRSMGLSLSMSVRTRLLVETLPVVSFTNPLATAYQVRRGTCLKLC